MAKNKAKKDKSKGKSVRDRSRRAFSNEKLQNRMKKSQQRSKGGVRNIIKPELDIQTWRPKDGDHIVDVIPYLAGEHDPIIDKGEPTYTLEIHVHRNVGPDKAVYLCLERMYGDKCPICEHRQKLRDKGADEDVWKPLFPQKRHMYNIVCYDKGEEKKGIQVWDEAFFYSEKNILAIANRPARGGKKRKTSHFSDPDKGQSIAFTVEPAKGKNDYPSFVGFAFEARDYKVEDDLLEEAHTLDEIIVIPSYEEVKEAYWGSKGKAKDDDDGDGDDSGDNDLLDELDEIDDFEDLEEFVDDNDIDVKLKKRKDIEWNKDKVKEFIEESQEQPDSDGDGDGDGDEDPDLPSKKEVKKMDYDELCDLVEEHDLNLDPDDYDEDEDDDVDEFKKDIIEELDL